MVGDTRVQLSQSAAPCAFSLSPTGDSIGSAGGRLAFDVHTLTGCAWSAAADAAWIAIASGQSGNANGTITLTIAANTGAARVGHVNVAGRSYTISQAGDQGPAPGPSPTPTPPPPPSSGEQVHIEGTAFVVGGSCPVVTFYVGLQQIVTDSNTEYDKKNDCSDLRTGRGVAVDGIDTGDTVRATKIRFDKNNDLLIEEHVR